VASGGLRLQSDRVQTGYKSRAFLRACRPPKRANRLLTGCQKVPYGPRNIPSVPGLYPVCTRSAGSLARSPAGNLVSADATIAKRHCPSPTLPWQFNRPPHPGQSFAQFVGLSLETRGLGFLEVLEVLNLSLKSRDLAPRPSLTSAPTGIDSPQMDPIPRRKTTS
jgi:hypothetical protein